MIRKPKTTNAGPLNLLRALLVILAATLSLPQPVAFAQDGENKTCSGPGAGAYAAGEIPKLFVNDHLNPAYVAFMAGIFPCGIPKAPVDAADQHLLYRYCVALFESRNYKNTLECLDNVRRSVELHGDTPPTPYIFFGNPIGVDSQKKGAEYPLKIREHMLRAETYLDLGDVSKAATEAAAGLELKAGMNFTKQLNPLNQDSGRVLPRTLCERANGIGFVFCGDRLHGWVDVASSLAIIFWMNGDHDRSTGLINELKGELSSFNGMLDKTYKTKIRAALTRAYMARKEYKQAIEVANDEAHAGTDIVNLVLGIAVHDPSSIIRTFSDQHNLSTRFQVAHARLEAGDLQGAKPYLDEILSNPDLVGIAGIYWATLYDRGRIAESEGDPEKAIDLYQHAVEEIERQRSTIDTESAKIGFFGNKQDVYRSLIRLLFRSGRLEGAFLVGERSKSRALVDMLASKQDFRISTPQAKVVQQLLNKSQANEIALSRDTTIDREITTGLTRRLKDKAEAKPEDLLAIINDVRNLKVEAQQQLARQAPELASLVSVSTVSLAEIQEALPADETLVSYYSDDQDLYAFLIEKTGFKALKLDREKLEERIKALREAIEDRSDAYRDSAKALYSQLIDPLLPHLGKPKLLIAGHGKLHYLPFAALHDGQGFLLDRFQLTYLPSASTLKFVGKPPVSGRSGTLLAIGNPDLGDRQYDLPYAEKEARVVAAIFPKSALLIKRDASKKNLREYGSGFAYLHFATHGKFDADNPLGSALLLAGNSANDEADRLTVGELYSMNLSADLVTLSACETGLGKIANGDDVVGLVRGFLYAGANRVVSTLWPIDDAATSSLMTSFYANLKGGKKKAQALREAQISLRKDYPHPFFWAAFQMTAGQ
jgi:CHAT domain-containing protein